MSTIHAQLATLVAVLTPACEVYYAVSSPASGLLRKLRQPPACLPLMEAACLALSHPFAYVVLALYLATTVRKMVSHSRYILRHMLG